LLLAFASVRERRKPPYPVIYFYELDAKGGRLAGSIDSVAGGVNATRADMHPSLSRDGRFCAFAAQFGVTDGGRIEIWDRSEKRMLPLAEINDFPNVHQMTPSFASAPSLVAFAAWGRPGGSPRWGVYVYDLTQRKLLPSPRAIDPAVDDRMPALSGDGRRMAFCSRAKGGAGSGDILLCHLPDGTVDALANVNSPHLELQPSLSGDGGLLAFSSDRPGGEGGRDIYLYDLAKREWVALPGLNSPNSEQSPSLSADGRYMAFVSERLDGAGEKDVYLYDRQNQILVPLPDLNSKDDDFDPCVVVLP
jgi:Tol biopolymer transport system component